MYNYTHKTIHNTQCYGTEPPTRDKIFVANGRKRSEKEALETGCTFSAWNQFFQTKTRKKRFLDRLDRAKSATSSDGCSKLDNYSLLSKLLNRYEEADSTGGTAAAAPVTTTSTTTTTTPADNRSMLKHSGMYCDFLIAIHINMQLGQGSTLVRMTTRTESSFLSVKEKLFTSWWLS